MDLGLAGRTAVVLASTAGLGRAVAEELLDEGAWVAVSGRDPGRLDATVAELRARHGDRVHGARLDVADPAALGRHLDEVAALRGRVDVLVTNAGGPPPAGVLETDEAGFRRAWELTFASATGAARRVLPGMRAARWGRVVALASSTVRHPLGELVYSNVVRVALASWLKSLADEVAGDGVCVNAVATGMFATDRLEGLFEERARRSGRTADEERRAAAAAIPVGRPGEPRELAALVAFLCSERASFLTGAVLPVDGGAGRFLL